MGQEVLLTETFTGTGLPCVYDDKIMSAGALSLIDFNHSLGGYVGVPGNAALLPNIAWKTANALVAGAPGQSALSAKINATSAAAPSYPLIERTPKLGLHAIRSQASDVSGALYNMELAAAIETYMQTNRAHAFYFGIWDYMTRAGTTAGSPYGGLASVLAYNTSNYLFDDSYSALEPQTSGNGLAGSTSSGRSNNLATGARLATWGANGFTGTYSGSPSVIPYIWGGTGGPFVGLHIGASQILYRQYIEDLTVSAAAGGYANNGAITVAQRFAEVVARDTAMYNAAVNLTGSWTATDAGGNISTFTATGKLNGDTWTAPSGYP